jgi:TrmH family RNA methyltransferase
MLMSRDNPRLKAVRAVHERRGRREQQAYLVEGVTLVLEALATGQQPLLVLRDETRLSAGAADGLDRALAPHANRVATVTPAVFRELTTTETPQGVLAVLPMPAPIPVRRPREGDLVLVADGIQDPGNLGTMLRTAEAVGVALVATTAGTTDPFAPKVVRAGMGAHFRLPLVVGIAWPDLMARLGGGVPCFGADSVGTRTYDAVDWTQGGVVVIGNESGGLSAEAQAAANELIAIPVAAPVESLNAAVAAAVVLFEAARQRRQSHSSAADVG